MDIATIMRRDVATVRPDAPLDQAANLLRQRDCGCVVVIDEHRAPVGIVTDRDICLCALRHSQPLEKLSVKSAMSHRIHSCGPLQSIEDAERTMSLHQVRRLPVVNQHGKICGVLSLDDIARAAWREEDLFAPALSCAAVGRTLGQISRPRLLESQEA